MSKAQNRDFGPDAQELRRLIAGFSPRRDLDIGPDDDFEDSLGLDSIDRLNLIAAVEQRYGLHIDDRRLGDVSNLSALMRVIEHDERGQRS